MHQQDLKTNSVPTDGSTFALPPLPRYVAFQAWTLGHRLLTLLALIPPLALILLFIFRNKLRALLGPANLTGDYDLIAKIGEGGMGEVWAASLPDGSRYALKFIKKEFADDPEFKERLDREVETCKKLRHPHLLRLYNSDIATDGRVYTVSELLKGRTLKQVLASGEYDPPQLALKVIDEIGDSLDYLHQRKLVHRDVKPDNIFACSNGNLKLMDMGLLRGEEVTKLTMTGQMVGTPAYMPPEQMGTDAVDGTADQYSMGIILYEILTGQRPFTATEPVVIAYQHMHVAPEPPSTHQPRITPEIEAAILRMIMKKSEERFPSMKDAQEALEGLRFLTWADTTEETRAGTLKKPPH